MIGKIDWTAEKIVVVGDGQSLNAIIDRLQVIPDGCYVIAIRNAVELIESNACFRLTRPQNRGDRFFWIIQKAVPSVKCISARVQNCRVGERGVLYLRHCNEPGFSDNPSQIHGDDICAAMNVAYHMKPKKIAIFGIDLENLMLETALEQIIRRKIDVVTGSLESDMRHFARASQLDTLNWISR